MFGDGGEDFIIMPVVYPRGTVSVSSLSSLFSVGYFSKPSHTSFPVSLGARQIQ